MKKILTLLLTLLLICPAACHAESAPVMSPELYALQTANAALMDRYGLTLPALGGRRPCGPLRRDHHRHLPGQCGT